MEHKKIATILQLKTLKEQGHITELKGKAALFKAEFRSMKAAANSLNVPEKSFRNLLSSKPEDKEKKSIPCNIHAKSFWKQDGISITDPSIQHAGKRFLLNSVEEMYRLYKSDCEKVGFDPISFSHFNMLRPKKVFTLKNIPDKYCICDICENHKMSKSALEKAGVQSILSKCSAEMMNTMCSENVGQDQYTEYQCISHACDKCGAQKFKSELMSHNQHLDWNSTVNWRHWGYE